MTQNLNLAFTLTPYLFIFSFFFLELQYNL